MCTLESALLYWIFVPVRLLQLADTDYFSLALESSAIHFFYKGFILQCKSSH